MPKLGKGNLHIIVSHGKYLEEDVLKTCIDRPNQQRRKENKIDYSHNHPRPKKIQNLEAHLIRYDLQDDRSYNGTYQQCDQISYCNRSVLTSKKDKSTVTGVVYKVFQKKHKGFATCDYKYHDKGPTGLSHRYSIKRECKETPT